MNIIKSESAQRKTFKVAVVVSLFNRPITAALQESTLERLMQHGFHSDEITVVEVPGAFEIPLVVKRLARKKIYGAIIALGAVIRGETTHYESICAAASEGCLRVALDHDIPVIFGVLTTENEAQAWDRLGGKQGNKGHDAADCALNMHGILTQLEVSNV